MEYISKMKLYSELDFIFWGSDHKSTDNYVRNFTYYGIQYNHHGKMFFKIDDNETEIVEGSYAFISKPNFCIHYGSLKGETRDHNFVTFSGKRIKEYEQNDLIDKKSPELVFIHDANNFMETLYELHKELWRNKSSLLTINLTDKLLIMLNQEKQRQQEQISPYFHTLNNLFYNISDNPILKWNFEKEAKMIGISLPHFRRLFTQQFSVSPQHFLIKMRLNLASRLLVETDLQIQEIAEQCGFTDIYFFSKQFKRFNNVSPLAFRKMNTQVF